MSLPLLRKVLTMKRAALFLLSFVLSLAICGASEAEAGKRQRCCIPQQYSASPGFCGPQQPSPCQPRIFHSTGFCWCLQFPIMDDGAGNTLYYVDENQGCSLNQSLYRWYPTTSKPLPEICYSTTNCECENDPGSARLERDTTQASLLFATNVAGQKTTATTLVFNIADSRKVTLASAMLQPPSPPHISAAFPNDVGLADLAKGPKQQPLPDSKKWIWGHHPWKPGWRIQWAPTNGLHTHDATQYVNVIGKDGAAIPVKVLIGGMHFDKAGNPKHQHGNHHREIVLGIEVTSIPDTVKNPPTITPAVADILTQYHAKIRLPGGTKDIDILTHKELR